ncbi:hypothetical protein Oweho_0182 [Owenweeksia hongkongensis DSM 17368]|uniref:Uncharacterized protein n=1 Tax=Owenweeksia hongkongensis (strain DSM 17368 / CIP 108786 / JCM 12287 / NRRL B-23963 / UST20020801) TaxID=926562 RepID=G8R6R1_OWEHD|nr:hypothetical protein [Owenweeksia hongkongensis]AEV31204.1 hypothetical protein Oweho_0182 [Owenweeksia hongkongensis DSM 17368]
MDLKEIQKLIRYIEENTRADKVSGIEFIDPRNFKSKIHGKQNYVVFGRRGAGKSTLLKTLQSENDNFTIYVNLEDYKDITFPNIIIKVLIRFFEGTISKLDKDISFWSFGQWLNKRKLNKDLKNLITELKKKISSPDSLDEQRKYKETKQEGGSAGTKAKGLEANLNYSDTSESEIAHQWKIDKLNDLKTSIDDIKALIERASELTDKQIILVLDDFYFIPKSIQPYLIDYFHRLSKSNNFYLKIGTVKHRTNLYVQTDQSFIGMELNADVYDIDLDYTLDKWNELKRFKKDLLDAAINSSGANIDVNEIFNDQAFEQLCIASGGVPRDFLVLFIKCCSTLNENSSRINVPNVREVAIENYTNKKNALEKDSIEESNILENTMSSIRDRVFTDKRTNVFLIENESLDKDETVKRIIKELIDLRFIHIIDSNTSAAPSDGKRHSAYLLDVSLYTNGRPRNFKEIEPDIKKRRDDIRSAPRISVLSLNEIITGG